MPQESMTLFAFNDSQCAQHVAKYEDVRRLGVCTTSLHDVIRPRFQIEWGPARPPTQLQVQQIIAAIVSAGCVVPAQISVDEAGLHMDERSPICPWHVTALSRCNCTPMLSLQDSQAGHSLTWQTQVLSALHELHTS